MPLDPQLLALQQSLTAVIAGGQLALDAASMGPGSPPIVALWKQAFGLNSITLGGTIGIVANEANNTLRVSGSGITPLFNVGGMAVALTFGSATASTLSVRGTVTPPALPVWTFSTSFPDLALTLFETLSFTDARFTLATAAGPDPVLGLTLVQGVGLQLQPTGLAGPLEPAARLAPPPSPLPRFYGPVTQTADARTIALALPYTAVTLDLSGFPLLSFPQPSLVLRNAQRASTSFSASDVTLEDDVYFGFGDLALAIVLPGADAWRLGLRSGGATPVPSVSSLLALFTGSDLAGALPQDLLPLPGFWLTTLSARFDLDSGRIGAWSIVATTAPPDRPPSAAVWSVIPGVLEVRALTLTLEVAQLRPGAGGPVRTRIGGSIAGQFHIGGAVDVQVVIPLPVTREWVFATAGAVVLPSLRDLSKLVAGVDPGSLLPQGAGTIGDFTLASVVLTLDPVKPAIVVFSFTLVSTNDWVIVPPERLSIRDLQLAFQIDAPFGERRVSGVVAGTLRIGAWDIDVVIERGPFERDWRLQIASQALPLPSIGDLDRLAGTGLAPYLPQTLATASFTLHDLLIDVNLSQKEIRQLAFRLESDQAWTVIDEVLVIERAGLYIDLSWFTGDLLASFGVWGALRVVGTGIDVSADRLGPGEWNFRGALAAGETISLGGLVGQFLGIHPAYLPSLQIEGLAATFSTPSNDFSFEGRTAGLWTYEVSSALTLRMHAEAAFRRVSGQNSGYLAGSFFINSLNVFASYAFDATSSTLLFRLSWGAFDLSAALTSGTNAKGRPFSLLTFRLGDLSFGAILESMVRLVSPGSTFRLEPPWDALNQINLKNLSLVIDLKTRDVTVNYDVSLNLVFASLTAIGLKYDTSSGEGSVKIQLSGHFLDQEYNLANGNPLEWEPLREPAPSVPAQGPKLFDLRYLGLGQRVSFTRLATLDTVGEVIAAMRAQMAPQKDATRNPLATDNGSAMRFDRASGILAGADFEILSTLSASLVFNDPYLYGMRLALAGERAGSLAGLSFELLYKKVSDDIGVFKVELRVPDAFRQFEFGAVSVTLPIIKVDVYTNGNFRVDLGFPRSGNFSDSFCLQVFPFIGWGGFYFAALTGATSARVPRVTDGSFHPVIEAGLGLQVGLGKEIRKGPLSGGIYVTVVGIMEGAVAWFTPNDIAARDGIYYWIEGSIGIVGKVYGEVDFAVIKVSVRLEARLTVRFALEAYEATHVRVTVEVEAEASVKVFFIRISFSFSVNLDEEFTIGSRQTPPWLVAPAAPSPGEQPRLRMQHTRWRARTRQRELRLRARSVGAAPAGGKAWDPVLVFATKQELPLTLLPALTVATPPGASQPALQIAFVLLAENGVAPSAGTRPELRQATAAHSSRTSDPMALSFNLLVEAMLHWAICAVTGAASGTVTAGDLEHAYALLDDEATFNSGFGYGNLKAFFANNFNVHISGLPTNLGSATVSSGTVVAMLPPLSLALGNTPVVHFETHNPVSQQYEADIRRYYDQLLVDYEYGRAHDPAVPPARLRAAQRLAETVDGDESMATLIFREYMMIVAKSAVQAARDCLTRFSYPVTATDSLDTIAGQFPAVPLAQADTTLRVTSESIAWANRTMPVTGATPWTVAGLTYQIRAGDSLDALATTFGLAAASDLIALAANASSRQLLAVGAPITVAQSASPDDSWFDYASVEGDGLLQIAVWAFVRAQTAAVAPDGAWYAQTIADFNTDPLLPYAGPDLAGVIATGTPLRLPAALNDSDRTHATTYVARAGDTLDLVAACADVRQNAPQRVQTISAAMQTLNPGVDWVNLAAGTTVHVPAQTCTVAAGDSFATIAARFLLAPTDLAQGGNARATALLAPLAVLALPTLTYTTVDTDTIADVAEKLNTPVADLATQIAGVAGLFRYPASLTIPEVPACAVATLVRTLVLGSHANEVAMAVSRFVASGLRLPAPQGGSGELEALYALTGQQQNCPVPPATFNFSSSAAWIDFVDSTIAMPGDTVEALRVRDPRFDARNPLLGQQPLRAGMHLLLGDAAATLPIAITQALLDTYAPSTRFDPQILSGPSPLDIKRRTAITYRFDRSMHWQTPVTVPFAGTATAPLTGEPSLWLLPEALERRAKALGWGSTPFALFTAAGDASSGATETLVARYEWATLVRLSVRQTAAAHGQASLPHTCEIAGTDADGKARLLALLSHLSTPAQTDTAQAFILYTPNADKNNPHGLASGSVDTAATFVLRTNLATLTASGPHAAHALSAPKSDLYAATLAHATDFVQLLWEASVTASGGYFLNYTDTAGNGLPDGLFAAQPLGELYLLFVLASQSATLDPDRTLHAFNNCALVGDNIDTGEQTVHASASDAAQVEWRASASIPPGNAGFALTRTNPGVRDDADNRTRQLYSLLAFHTEAAGGFAASNEGLPVSPVRPDLTAADVVDAPWQYTQVLQLARLASSTLPQAAFLPLAAADPYAGIAPHAKLRFAMDFHDVYGNETTPQTPIATLDLPIGCYDDVIGMAQWPGIVLSYHVAGSTAAPAIGIDAALQVGSYLPGGGATFEAVQQNAHAHLARLRAVYYQIWQDGVGLQLTTSLVQQPNEAPHAFDVDRLAVANFVSACCVFLGAAQRLRRAARTARTDTLDSLARSLTADVAYLDDTLDALGRENHDTPTASLFAAPVAMPEFDHGRFGDTLGRIVARAGLPAITEIELATNNASVLLNAGIDIAAPPRTSAPATLQTCLQDVAAALHAMPGAIGDANATVRGLLAADAQVTVGGVTVAVEVDPGTGQTWSLADLQPKFEALGVTTAPAAMAVANQQLVGLIAAGQTLCVRDYLLQPGDTFARLALAVPAFTIDALATAAAASPNLFPAGVPLFIRAADAIAPSATQTLRTLADKAGLTVAQIVLANPLTALVPTATVWLPDRVTIDAADPASLSAYTVPAAGVSVDAIVQAFGEPSALGFATRNWNLRAVFVPQQTITVGATSTPTQADDSLAAVCGRLQTQQASITPAQFVDAIAPATTLLRAGALFAVLLPSTGAAPVALQTLGQALGADPVAIALANASLAGFVLPQIPLRLGTLALITGPAESWTNLVLRFAQELGASTTVAALAQDNLAAACLAAGQRFMLPPAPLAMMVPLVTASALPVHDPAAPAYPGNPFELFVDLTIEREVDRIDPQFSQVASVAAATTRLPPRTTAVAGSGTLSLESFAQGLEAVYPALKLAVGGDTTEAGTRNLWLVNFGPGGVTSIAIDRAAPSFFALPPLATSLQDLPGVPIRSFDAATGALVPQADPPRLDFLSIDPDVWAGICLAAVEQLLTPPYAPAAFALNAAAFSQIVGAKQTLAARISTGLRSILAVSSGNVADAAERLRQQLLVSLAAGHGTTTVLQYPVQVDSGFSAGTAPRLLCSMTDEAFRTGARADLASLSAHFGVPQAALALLLGDSAHILATGTAFTFKGVPGQLDALDTLARLTTRLGATGYPDLVANLATPDGLFQPYTALNIDRIEGKAGDAAASTALLTLADLVDNFHTPLPLLAAMLTEQHGLFIDGVTIRVPDHGPLVIGNANNALGLVASTLGFDTPAAFAQAIQLQTGILDPACPVELVRFVPEHTLSSSRLSLAAGASTLNALFDVRSQSRAKNMFLRLGLHINELEHGIAPVANGFEASQWLSFVRPIAQATRPLATDLGEVLIPIPLRAYPAVPSMNGQSGSAAVPVPVDLDGAKAWRYAFDYQHRLAAQDRLYVDARFNLPLGQGGLRTQALSPDFGAALAQFVSAWPAVDATLTALVGWNGAASALLAQTLQTLADMAEALATHWTPGLDAAPAGGTRYAYGMSTTVRPAANGPTDALDTLRVSLLGGGQASPTGSFPGIDWRLPGGEWRGLALRSHSATEAVYGYVEDVPADLAVQHQLRFSPLDTLAWQNGSGSVRLTRNEHLVGNASTAPAFVYSTLAVGFAEPAVPLIQHDTAIAFNGGLALQPALTKLFADLLGTSPTGCWLKVAVEFGYELVETQPPAPPIVSFLPIGFLPASPFDAGLPERIFQLIAAWRGGKPFQAAQGLFSLDITVFTTLTPPAAARRPILRLQHMVYENGAGTTPLAPRLWARRPIGDRAALALGA